MSAQSVLNYQVPKKKDLLVKLAYIGSIVVGGIFQLVASFWCEARFPAYSAASLVLLHVSWTIMAFGLLVFYLRKVLFLPFSFISTCARTTTTLPTHR